MLKLLVAFTALLAVTFAVSLGHLPIKDELAMLKTIQNEMGSDQILKTHNLVKRDENPMEKMSERFQEKADTFKMGMELAKQAAMDEAEKHFGAKP